jgi:hypothetical protein
MGLGHPLTARPPEAVLVFGRGESSLAALAAGLAHRADADFGWVSCAEPSVPLDPYVGSFLAAHAAAGRAGPADPHDFETWDVDPTALDALTVAPTDRDVLLELLRLPGVFQAVVPYPPDPAARPSLVLAWVDALPSRVVAGTLLEPTVFETLRRAGVTLVATFRGVAPSGLRGHFDRSFRVRAVPGSPWEEARVSGDQPGSDLAPVERSLRDAWGALGLDAGFLVR